MEIGLVDWTFPYVFPRPIHSKVVIIVIHQCQNCFKVSNQSITSKQIKVSQLNNQIFK